MSGQWKFQVAGLEDAPRMFLTVEDAAGAVSFVETLRALAPEPGFPYVAPLLDEGAGDPAGIVFNLLQAALDEAWRVGLRPRLE